MDFGLFADSVDRKTLVNWCREDRDRLTEEFFILRPEYEGCPPALWVEELLDALGFKICFRPMHPEQLGLCNMASRHIYINTRPGVSGRRSARQMDTLRRSTLAHELGHVRMHQGEMASRVYVHLHSDGAAFDNPRAYQRENEAELYAALFLVPKAALQRNRLTQALLRSRRDGQAMNSGKIWEAVHGLAKDFYVSPTLIQRTLVDLGLLEARRSRPGARPILGLKMDCYER